MAPPWTCQNRKHDLTHNALLNPPIAHGIPLCIILLTFYRDILQTPCTTVFPRRKKHPCPGLAVNPAHIYNKEYHTSLQALIPRIFVFLQHRQLSTLASLRLHHYPSKGRRSLYTLLPTRALVTIAKVGNAQKTVKHTEHLQNVANRPLH